MAVFYGQDTYDLTDLPLIDTQVTGKLLIGLRLARRLQTDYGALAIINDDPDFGYNVVQLLRGKMNAGDIRLIRANIQNELLKDEQVADVTADITQDPGKQDSFTIAINVSSSVGPFQLTLNISSVTYSILFVNQG